MDTNTNGHARSYSHQVKPGEYNSIYSTCFKGVPADVPYVDRFNFLGFGEVDLRPQLKSNSINTLKALSTTSGGAGTAGYALVPVFVDPTILDQKRIETPLRDIIPRVTQFGTIAAWNERTERGNASSAGESAPLPVQNDSYDRYTQTVKYHYAVGSTTGPMEAAMPPGNLQGFATTSFMNPRQLEVANKTANLSVREEIDIINGYPGGTYAGANTDTGYDAYSVLSTAQYGIKYQVSDENQTDQAGAAITLDAVNDSINEVWEDSGRTSLMVTDGRTVTDLKALMVQQMRTAPVLSMTWGHQSIAFEGPRGSVPVIQSQNVRTDAGDGSGTIQGSKSILLLDMGAIENRILLDYTYEPLAKTTDENKFMVKYYGTVLVGGVNTTNQTSFHGSIIDIA